VTFEPKHFREHLPQNDETIAPGAKFGPYEILSPIAAGEMQAHNLYIKGRYHL
jgi:hypothetical protein